MLDDNDGRCIVIDDDDGRGIVMLDDNDGRCIVMLPVVPLRPYPAQGG